MSRFYEHDEYNVWFSITEDNLDSIKKDAGIELRINDDGEWKSCVMLYVDNIDDFYISKIFEKLPNGLLDKKITGFGATTLEMHSKRNSIIVMPTKNLAYSKHLKLKSSIYVGSEIGDIKSSVSVKDIKDYLSDESNVYKKILVVADSLWKVYKAIGVDSIASGEYHIMIDEVDKFMRDSSFRGRLSDAMDYYFEFPFQHRTLVTATIANFCDPRIRKEEKTRFEFSRDFYPKREIRLYPTDNVVNGGVLLIKDMLKKNPHDKILVAYNAVENPLKMLSTLKNDNDLKGVTWGLACSDSRKNEAGIKDYYVSFNELDDGRLPRQVCFTTSTNFVGIDLEDDYHLVFIADSTTMHHTINQANLVQIYGRNRKKGGVLSESFMFRSSDIKEASKEMKKEGWIDGIEEMNVVHNNESFLSTAERVIDIAKEVEKVRRTFRIHDLKMGRKPDVKKFREKLKKDPVNIANLIGDNRVYIRRSKIKDKLMPDYFLIDSYIEEDDYESVIYSRAENVVAMIKGAHIRLGELSLSTKFLKTSQEKDANANLAVKKNLNQCVEILNELIPLLREKDNQDRVETQLNAVYKELMKKNPKKYDPKHNSYINTMQERLRELMYFLRTPVAAQELEKFYVDLLKGKNPRGLETKEYNNLYNTILFTSIAPSDPFKKKINRILTIGKTYTKEDALEAFRDALLGIGIRLGKGGNNALTGFFGLLFEYKIHSENNKNEKWTINSYNRLGIDKDAIRSRSIAAIKNMQKSRERSSSRLKYKEELIFKGSGFRVLSEEF